MACQARPHLSVEDGCSLCHRPHVAGFIARVRTARELAVWTSATKGCADLVVRSAFPADLALAFVWSRERCTWRHHPGKRGEYWLKILRKVARPGCDPDGALMVDDKSRKLEKNHGNPIERSRVRAVSPFTRLAG